MGHLVNGYLSSPSQKNNLERQWAMDILVLTSKWSAMESFQRLSQPISNSEKQ
jgi:hypothetical protein